jgi:hypothetical protein
MAQKVVSITVLPVGQGYEPVLVAVDDQGRLWKGSGVAPGAWVEIPGPVAPTDPGAPIDQTAQVTHR